MQPTGFDNIIALKVLYMLVTPFDKTDAFKQGVIDRDGKLLVKFKDQTPEQRKVYNYLDRLIFNLKRLIGKLPGGKSLFASYIAALYLIRENAKLSQSQLELSFNSIMSKIEDGVILVEETLFVEKFLKDLEEDGAPANVTGAAVSTDIPVIRKKKKTPIAKRPDVVGI